jgi:hypothetical protein
VNVWFDPPLGWGASTRRRLRREDVALQSLTAEIERLRDIVQPSLVPIGGMARFIGVPCIESARFIAVAVHLATRPVQCALFFWLPRQRRTVCPELDAGFGPWRSGISLGGDRRFRTMAIGRFARWRSPVSDDGDQRFRSMTIT